MTIAEAAARGIRNIRRAAWSPDQRVEIAIVDGRFLGPYGRYFDNASERAADGSPKPRDFTLLGNETADWESCEDAETITSRHERMAAALHARLSDARVRLPSETEGFHVRQALEVAVSVVADELDELESRILAKAERL